MQRPVLLLLAASLLASTASAEVGSDVALRFSHEENVDAVQPGCTTFSVEHNPCHQIATMMNGLDTPKIDILILVPASPTAERDLRIMRQSVEMWADGFTWLANDMGLAWLRDGVEFHIFAEPPAPVRGEAEFTTYPILDPEIVVIATNPVGGLGIGVDPVDLAGLLFGEGVGQGPCHGVANPFDMSLWENLPGYDSHHGGRGGTYTEDCEGAGGNICFSVNGAIDPATSVIDVFQLYDLVSHETGHCLTQGHVGDGAEGSWSSVPTNDIMAYNSDPPGISKCVSTLNVEALAVAMSQFLDVNGDGIVNSDDYWFANDAIGDGDGTGRPFQIQHPDNHWYASPTRKAIDCPQPDMGPVPLAEVYNFTPPAPPRLELAILDKDQPVGARLVTVHGLVNGSAPGRVVLSATAPADLGGNDTDLGIANVTVDIVGGRWSGAVDLSGLSDGQAVVVSARWLDAQDNLLDSDRVAFVVSSTVAEEGDASGSADTPGLALPLLMVALVAALVGRRN